MKTGTTCPNCGQALAEGEQSCFRCGTVVCSSCGGALLPQDRFCGRCGTPRDGRSPSDPTLLDPASDAWDEVLESLRKATLGEFIVRSELGRGGMAAVYLAHEVALNRKVAIKVMAPGLMMGKGMVERFKQEAVTVANLNHPNIVTVHAVRQAGGLHFFVMKLIPGRSLERIIRDVGPLPLPVVRGMIFQIGSALNYAHRRGVVHRDVKPSNILMDEDGNAVVTDFGIAKVVETPSHTLTGSTVGTPAYMSPEQCWSKEVTGASDQYSLGILAYEMLTGEPPFTGPTLNILRAHTEDPPPSVRTARPDCPSELETALLRMLAKVPDQRWPTVMNAVEALGGGALGESDPLRETLIALGHRGPEQPSLDYPRTPRSPIPSRQVPVDPSAEAMTVLPGPGLIVSAPAASLRVGAAMQLAVVARNAAGSQVAAPSVTWISSDPQVASVSAGGVVRGLEPGSIAVSARTREGAGGTVRLRVTAVPVGAVAVESPRNPLKVGDEVSLTVVVTATTGSLLTDRTVTWTSSAPRVARVSPAGRLCALLPGSVTISASADGVLGYVTLTIEPAAALVPEVVRAPAPRPARIEPRLERLVRHVHPRWWWAALGAAAVGVLVWMLWPRRSPDIPAGPAISMQVLPAQLALRVGDTARVQAVLSDPAGRPVRGRATWASSDTSVATVSATGVVTGRAPGDAAIVAAEGTVRRRAKVTVSAPRPAGPAPVASIEVRPGQVRVTVGRSARLRAVLRDGAGALLDRRRVLWSSGDPGIARVSGSGVVTGAAAGQASVTATSEDVTSEPVLVTVEALPPAARYATVRTIVIPWAYVTIDGRGRQQRVRGEDRLTAGVSHRFRFERGGFVTVDTTLILQPDEQRLLRVQMRARQP
jgi:serine/threonine protein kinase/uncharacterized protein YjdB